MAAHPNPVELQRRYYASTAGAYDGMHERQEHIDALEHTGSFLARLGSTTVLDTGCGTGLAMRHLARAQPQLELWGNDPSPELLQIAVDRYGLPADRLDVAVSDPLPYEDGSFDAVVATGMLHHVPDPNAVVAEMLRVARQAIFISDANWYAMGRMPVRLAKLALTAVRLDRLAQRWRHGGHEWFFTEGDGVGWVYSVFDSLPLIRAACAQVLVLPVGAPEPLASHSPLLFSKHCLVAGFKAPLPLPVDVEGDGS